MSKYKITRLYSEKENERIAQKGLGSVNLNFDAMRSQSDSDKDTSGINNAAATANKPLEGVMGYNYIPGRGAIGRGGDNLGSADSGQPAEMEIDPEMMASMSPKLQTLHSQYLTSTPTGRENFLQEAKTIIALLGNTLTPQNKNYIIANFPGFARLF
jgi:hypothetical protein